MAHRFRARRNRSADERSKQGTDNQRAERAEDAPRHVSRGVMRFFRRQRQLLDPQIDPQSEWQRGKDSVNSEGEPGAATL